MTDDRIDATVTTSAPDDEARDRLIAAIQAAKARPLLPFHAPPTSHGLTCCIQGLRLLRQQNPVIIEALHRGDYADFAEQLRRGRGKWAARDVKRALPFIDRWARENGNA